VSSLSKDRNFVNSQEILDICKNVFTQCRHKNIKCNLGGAISSDSFKFIDYLVSHDLLDKFETRYIIFDAKKTIQDFHNAIQEAQKFEYHYLINKGNSYEKLANEDKDRVQMIQKRLSNG
jgi:hypothetical protein